MAKKKGVNEPKKKSRILGFFRFIIFSVIFFAIIYVAGHIYFLIKPADEHDDISEAVMKFEVMGLKPFPAVRVYTTEGIAGRPEIIKGWLNKTPKLRERLQSAIEGDYPVTFREDELNAWLSKRLVAKQTGLMEPYVKNSYVWVDLTEGQMDVIIEREFINRYTHVTSLLLKFTRFERGYGIQPYSAQIGQVKAPGGLARIIVSPFEQILEELSEELLPYSDRQIRDIHIEDGQITLDPRTVENRL